MNVQNGDKGKKLKFKSQYEQCEKEKSWLDKKHKVGIIDFVLMLWRSRLCLESQEVYPETS